MAIGPNLIRANVDALLARARREVDDGLLPSWQIALAYQGEIVLSEVFGANGKEAVTVERWGMAGAGALIA